MRIRTHHWIAAGAFLATAAFPQIASAQSPVAAPPPAVSTATDAGGDQTIVLAGGCFWGVQAVFQHVKGVTLAESGYAGGNVKAPSYEDVSSGDTGHAESVKVVFDPKQVSYAQLLQIYFSVVQDPTERDFQGPDHGTQYRSDIFAFTPAQKSDAAAYIAQLDKAHVFDGPIVTRVDAFTNFYPAEAYHQNYALLHPDNPYIVYNDAPKVANLQRLFPALYRQKPGGLVGGAS